MYVHVNKYTLSKVCLTLHNHPVIVLLEHNSRMEGSDMEATSDGGKKSQSAVRCFCSGMMEQKERFSSSGGETA